MDIRKRNSLLLDTCSPSELFLPLAHEKIGESKNKTIFYCDDNYVAFGFLAAPLAGADDQVVKRLAQLIVSNWPIGTVIQFNLWSSPDVYKYTRSYTNFHQFDNEFLREIVSRHSQYLDNASTSYLDKRSMMPLRSNELIISIKIPAISIPTRDRDYEQYEKYIEEASNGLTACNFSPILIDADMLCEKMQSILNWDLDSYWRHDGVNKFYDKKRFIRESFFDPGNRLYREDHDSLQVGNKYVGVMSVKEFPQFFCLHDMTRLFGDVFSGSDVGIKTNFLVSMTIIVPDSEKEKSALDKKKQNNNRQALGPMRNWVPKYVDIQNDFDVLFKQLDEGDTLLKMCLSISIFADSKHELQGACSSAQNYWNGFDFRFLREKYLSLPMFLNSLPFNMEHRIYDELKRFRSMPSKFVAHFCPVVTEWTGGRSPAMIFNSRLGNPMFFDLFESDTSYSAICCAESGSGKSFLTQYIATNYLGYRDEHTNGAKVWIIDIGYSYKRLCDRVGGAYIDFDKEDLCINPFEFVKSYEDSSDMLIGILTVMAAPKQGLTDVQDAELRKALTELWGIHGKSLTIDHVAKYLIAKVEYPEIHDLGRQFFPFTSEGEYGRFFNGKSNIDLMSNQLTIFELEGLKTKPTLQRAVLYLIMYSISQAVNTLPKSLRKLVILDEAWATISSSDDSSQGASTSVGKFMEGLYRTIRKRGGAALVVTQSVADLYSTPSGRAIADNSPNMFLLGQKSSSIERAKQDNQLTLSDYEWDVMRSVSTKRPFYAEMFLVQGKKSGVARLTVDRAMQLLFTTEPKETSLLDSLEKSGMPLTESINTYIKYEKLDKLGDLRSRYQIEDQAA